MAGTSESVLSMAPLQHRSTLFLTGFYDAGEIPVLVVDQVMAHFPEPCAFCDQAVEGRLVDGETYVDFLVDRCLGRRPSLHSLHRRFEQRRDFLDLAHCVQWERGQVLQ